MALQYKVEGIEVDIKRVPELMPEEAARKAGAKPDQDAPIATVDELADYGGIARFQGEHAARLAKKLSC